MTPEPNVHKDADQAVRYADAVARVWIVGLLKSDNSILRAGAHSLSCVRSALAGETDAVELGCVPHELEAALATSSVEELRAALKSNLDKEPSA